ncbi:MAG: serine/threonine-protein kinase [Polyangiaceae bacterium]
MLTIQAGTLFAGDFRIVRPLARGGMGAVYVAEQLSTGRERALKVMLGDLASNADLRRRFEQEAKIGAQIASDHVVEVVAAGIDPQSGSPWLAMELLQGRDLNSMLAERGPLSANEVVELFEQLSHAVGAAHAHGIVHRDLKPENIFIAAERRAGGAYVAKILDFGIAKLVSQARTAATAAIGTPMWMAPEQMQHGSVIGPQADVWALGLIAFRALAGISYWCSARDPHASAMMLMREVAFDPLAPASARSQLLGGAVLPVGFDAWFARCVARDPSARFSDATVMFAAMKEALGFGAGTTLHRLSAAVPLSEGTEPTPPAPAPPTLQPTEPAPSTFAGVAPAPTRSPQRPTGLFAALGAVLVIGVGAAAFFLTRSPSAPVPLVTDVSVSQTASAAAAASASVAASAAATPSASAASSASAGVNAAATSVSSAHPRSAQALASSPTGPTPPNTPGSVDRSLLKPDDGVRREQLKSNLSSLDEADTKTLIGLCQKVNDQACIRSAATHLGELRKK